MCIFLASDETWSFISVVSLAFCITCCWSTEGEHYYITQKQLVFSIWEIIISFKYSINIKCDKSHSILSRRINTSSSFHQNYVNNSKTCVGIAFKSIRRLFPKTFRFQWPMPLGCTQNASWVFHKQMIFLSNVFNAVNYSSCGTNCFFNVNGKGVS